MMRAACIANQGRTRSAQWARPLVTVAAWLVVSLASAQAVPNMTSYQGHLAVGGAPYSGVAHCKFAIVDTTTAPETTIWSNDGSSFGGGPPATAVPVAVTTGSFEVNLGEPPAMVPIPAVRLAAAGSAVLRTWVDTGSGFVRLSDIRIGSSLYALHSRSAELSHGQFVANGLVESMAGGFKFPDGTVQTTAAACSDAFWSLTGNAGTDPVANYLGTSDEVELRLCIGGRRALRIEPTGFDAASDPYAPNIVCGRANNRAMEGVYGAAIGGGGAKDGEENWVSDLYGTVGGGVDNRAGDGDEIVDNAPYATVGGGRENRAAQWYATVAGGWENRATHQNTFVGGGRGNHAAGSSATIAGGYQNSADGNNATIAGGREHNAGGEFATVGGGWGNHANGYASAIPGGYGCVVTTQSSYSLAAGYYAKADEDGAFVWADNSSPDVMDSRGANTFTIRAAGGMKLANSDNDVTIKLDPTTETITTPVLCINGGCDLAEPFRITGDRELAPGTVVVIDEHSPGELKISERPYDTRVAGVVSGAGGIKPGLTLQQSGVLEGGQHIALTGRVYVFADAGTAPIRPGDLLTTSETPGHVMRAVNEARRPGAILGKALSSLASGRGLVLTLVSLQ